MTIDHLDTEVLAVMEPNDNAVGECERAENPTVKSDVPGRAARTWSAPKVSRLSIAETESATGSAADFEGFTL